MDTFTERAELVRRIVLNDISDDYENVDQTIFPNVAKQCAKLGFVVQRPQVVDALAGLIKDGLAKAFLLSGKEPARELQGMPPLEVVEEDFKTYFYITDKGRAMHLSHDDSWPFDDDGNPRI